MIIHEDPLNPPTIILIDPLESGNIGSVARAMMNFGLYDLRLVRPKSRWLETFTRQMASGANNILESARVFDTTEEAVSDLHVLYATASKIRDMIKPVLTPRRAAQEMKLLSHKKTRIGVLFGTERSGLENEDVMRTNALISIPTSADFDSLNLSQAVLLIGYEFFVAHLPNSFSEFSLSGKRNSMATQMEIEGFFEHLEEELDIANFWRIPEKKPDMLQNVRNIFNRIHLTAQEVQTLRGILKALVYHRWKIFPQKVNTPKDKKP